MVEYLDKIGLAYLWGKVKAWVSSRYLPLAGGTITADSVAPLIIKKLNTNTTIALQFKNYASATTEQTIGFVGFKEKDGELQRFDSSGKAYVILDNTNSAVTKSNQTLTVKINGDTESIEIPAAITNTEMDSVLEDNSETNNN